MIACSVIAIQESGRAYREYLNLVVIYYIPLDIMKKDGTATMQVYRWTLEHYNITVDEAHEFALHNMSSELHEMSMWDVISDSGITEVKGKSIEDMVPMYIITNKQQLYGAAMILYAKELFEDIQRRFKCKVVFLPSSTHELLVVPYADKNSLNRYLDMVRTVNNSDAVSDEDRLCDAVYYYEDGQVCVLQ